MSKHLERIALELKTNPGEFRRGELEAQRACYLSRAGAFVPAKAIVASLRERFGDGHSGKVTVWIMMAEALTWHYESLATLALDRAKRAELLSRMMGDRDLISFTSAWKAHFEFEISNFSAAFDSLAIAIDHASIGNLGANSRISNLICKSAMLCGEFDIEQKHFMLARDYALKDGDQVGIEAIQHNRAVFRAAWVRAQYCLGKIQATQITKARIDLASAKSLQNITGVSSHASYLKLAEARMFIMDGRFQDALILFEELFTLGPFPAKTVNNEFLELEVSYCQFNLNRLEASYNSFDKARNIDLSSIDVDEQLVFCWIRLQLCKRDSYFGDEAVANKDFEFTKKNYKKLVAELKKRLSSLPTLDN